MADDIPLKNCLTCFYGEHWPSNGEPSKYLCTRVMSEYLGEYFWANDDFNVEGMEINKNFLCHTEAADGNEKMSSLSTDVSETILSQA